MAIDEFYDFRTKLKNELLTDLIGPSSENEIIEDLPLTRYCSGVLYARQSGSVDPSQDIDTSEDDEETGFSDPPVALANVRYPSSMGMTFAVDPNSSKKIIVQLNAARYVNVNEAAKPVDEEDVSSASDKAANKRSQSGDPRANRRQAKQQRWHRVPLKINPVEIDITKPFSDYKGTGVDDLALFCRVRVADDRGAVPVTIVLLNRRQAEAHALNDADAIFQPQIEVSAPSALAGAFVDRPLIGLTGNDEDIRAYRLLFRHARAFATGHGCSLRWDLYPNSHDRATLIATTFAPDFDVPLADTNPDIKTKATEMLFLATASRSDAIQQLGRLCDGYDGWIKKTRDEIVSLSLDFEQQATAKSHLNGCEETLGRMRLGIDRLRDDENVWKAFVFANSAMLQNRARSVWLKNGKPLAGPSGNSDHRWYPFQLAFVLLCLDGIARSESPDRNFADLLWFPTGGGKTEAYLALIAFTAFLRRLRNKDGGGITALMRYTLRLLTIQQFERAALLICCCEAIRQKNPALGKEPISVGLWLGKGATPNTLAEARTALNKLGTGVSLDTENPIQLHSCPWCGAPLDRRNYWIATDRRQMVISCRQENCLFADRLPVFLIDEDVYKYRPTLVIATVDKFAGLPWSEKSAALFNLADGDRSMQAPPELIIQDELHLISGPLGTLVGLYETVVDAICTKEGVRPKVIASTATIRRAGRQVRGLFNREIRQFPPPGIDARDSYFAVEARKSQKGSRLYVGLMAPGTSHTTLLVRAYAALLQSMVEIPGSNEIKDPYWTLVGYFNSLRVLAGARMQVQDDVDDRMELLAAQHGFTKRNIDERIELTSRESSGDIPDHLKHMAVSYPEPSALAVILATNMISVGVDIDRLGLMVVMGQPQSTSEYIQSTSRVGRKNPGLVVVLFNAARSRDRSHYESFAAYHSALYRQVESTSVTPFSARARDRGLHAVLVALARLLFSDFRPNAGAATIQNELAKLESVKDLIIERVRDVDPDEADGAEVQLSQLILDWKTQRERRGTLVYRDTRDPSRALLRDASQPADGDGEGFPTLWSLRDVDQESNLYLLH
jgi:helicase-like protein